MFKKYIRFRGFNGSAQSYDKEVVHEEKGNIVVVTLGLLKMQKKNRLI